jgi:hypothetical protein
MKKLLILSIFIFSLSNIFGVINVETKGGLALVDNYTISGAGYSGSLSYTFDLEAFYEATYNTVHVNQDLIPTGRDGMDDVMVHRNHHHTGYHQQEERNKAVRQQADHAKTTIYMIHQHAKNRDQQKYLQHSAQRQPAGFHQGGVTNDSTISAE